MSTITPLRARIEGSRLVYAACVKNWASSMIHNVTESPLNAWGFWPERNCAVAPVWRVTRCRSLE
jgi:hypothetical protein